MKSSHLALLSIFLTTFLLSCSSGEDVELPEEYADLENVTIHEMDVEPISEIVLEPDAHYGDTEDVIIGRFGNSVADDDGRVYIGDYSENTIHIYDPDGTWVQNIGREGQGPGEFESVSTLKAENGHLHVLDRTQRRVSVYNLNTLEFVQDISLIPGSGADDETTSQFPSDFYVRSDGNYLVSFQGSPFGDEELQITVSLLDGTEGEYVEHGIQTFRMAELLTSNSSDVMIGVFTPYSGSSIFAYNNGTLVHGWTKHFLISFYDDEGIYQHARYYPFGHAALDRNDVITYYEDASDMVKQMVRNDDMPDTWPAFGGFVLEDNGRIWVSTIVEDQDVYNWWVLDESGELLSTFTWPRDKNIRQVKNGYLYSRETDEMGLVQLVRYTIQMPGL